jgi:UDP-N-acetylmuramoyl-tripeptide--D-alanyl-D-alanine ligase
MRITASEVALATYGHLIGPDISAVGIAFDSRVLLDQQAFVAIPGIRDGHDFLDDAFGNGAPFAIVATGRAVQGKTCVEVTDTVAALAALGQHCRKRLTGTVSGRVVGITGSVGKTSTKDLVRAVLASEFERTHAPEKSLNNDIGVPITIINAPDNCDALVLEMGMRGFGEIARLCDIAQPAIGVITAIGDAHGERVGGVNGVIRAKAELLNALPNTGTAIVNVDSELVMEAAKETKARHMTFGFSASSDLRCEIVVADDQGSMTVRFSHGNDSATGVVPLIGHHMVTNAAAAVAVGVTVGIPLAQCVRALENVVPAPQRMRWITGHRGARILDDSYNANPLSMIAALETVASIDATRRIAVLGLMAEVSDAAGAHRDIAAACARMHIELLPVDTDVYGSSALSVEEVLKQLAAIDESVVVLVKGSRVAATERVVQLLTD